MNHKIIFTEDKMFVNGAKVKDYKKTLPKVSEMENESIKDKKQKTKALSDLLSINDEIKSRRTGRILKCYSKLSIYNKENMLVDTEYSMWDAERKKTKGYRSKEIQNMMFKIWEKK